ncbi:MAG: MFS transporter [Armatimonadota bacterium]
MRNGDFMRPSKVLKRLKSIHPHLILFLLAIGCTGAAGGVFHTTFNNYLDDVYQISAETRGQLEFPRELPGLLVTLTAGALAFMPETRVGAVAMGCTALGFTGLAAAGHIDIGIDSWYIMVLFMFLWSIGQHLIMPVRESISMSLADREGRGRRLGQVRTVAAFATIIGAAVVYLTTAGYEMPPYWLTYAFGALFAVGSATLFIFMRDLGVQSQRPGLIIRSRYWLYYVLSLLFGARKQIFLTFAPWVLVRIFGQAPTTFAVLWSITAALSLFFIPAVGNAIDHFGERTVLIIDSFIILIICVVYGFAYHWGTLGLWITFVCFVLDQLLFSVSMARYTYVSKIAEDDEHVPACLAMGVTMDHAMGMSTPSLGGWIWDRYGHEWVFVGAAGIATLMGVFASMIHTPPPDE